MGVELAAVEEMLDEIDETLPSNRDQNSYTLGRMGMHNIVVAVMPEIGNNRASAVATQLLNDFQSIRFGLLVGIGGGIPRRG
jgi:nucleoside phosphorylase